MNAQSPVPAFGHPAPLAAPIRLSSSGSVSRSTRPVFPSQDHGQLGLEGNDAKGCVVCSVRRCATGGLRPLEGEEGLRLRDGLESRERVSRRPVME